MKNSLKSLFASVLVVVMIFGTFGIVASAEEAKATMTITETKVTDRADGEAVYKLVFKFKAPEGVETAKAANTTVLFSYDNTAIQPVMKKGQYGDMDLNNAAYAGFVIDAHMFSDRTIAEMVPGLDYAFLDLKWTFKGNRTGSLLETYVAENTDWGNVVDAAKNEMVVMEFYYRILDVNKMNNETFKIETEYADGTFLKDAYPDKNDVKSIWIGDYFYNATGKDDTIAEPVWSYTGYVAPSEDKEVSIAGIKFVGETTVTEPATPALTLAEVPTGVDAHIEYEIDGVWGTTVPSEPNKTYNVKVVATAQDGYVITDANAAPTTTVTINAKPVVEETNDLEITDENGTTDVILKDTVTKKEYKDLFVVDAVIKHGLEAGKTIVKWGVKFHDAANMTKGGGIVEFTPSETEVTIEGGELTFKAAIIGVPTGVTVKAVPFVVSK